MNRALWFVAGAGAGVYAVARARRAAEWLTPDGLSDRLAGLSLGVHLFGEEVRAGMAERESELRGRLQLSPQGRQAALPTGTNTGRTDLPRTGGVSTGSTGGVSTGSIGGVSTTGVSTGSTSEVPTSREEQH